jgi:hypothetical protein
VVVNDDEVVIKTVLKVEGSEMARVVTDAEGTVDKSVTVLENVVVCETVFVVSVHEVDVIVVLLELGTVQRVDERGAGDVTEGTERVVFAEEAFTVTMEVVGVTIDVVVVFVDETAVGVTSAVMVTVTLVS